LDQSNQLYEELLIIDFKVNIFIGKSIRVRDRLYSIKFTFEDNNNKFNPFDMIEIVHDLLIFYGLENEILVALLRQFK